MQFQPKFIIKSELVPPVRHDGLVRYLGRHFDFTMSNKKHNSEFVEVLESLLSDSDKLSMHPKKIAFLSKIYPFKNIREFDSGKYL